MTIAKPGIIAAGSGTDRETEPVTIKLHGDLSANPVFKHKKQPPNERCACGSGRKYKKCCNLADHERDRKKWIAIEEGIRQRRKEDAEKFPPGKRRPLSTATAALVAMMAAVSK